MSVERGTRAVMADGTQVELHPRLGSSPEAVVRALTERVLTGSGAALADELVETASGDLIAYGSIVRILPWPQPGGDFGE